MPPTAPPLDRVFEWLADERHPQTALQPLAGDVSSRMYLRRLEPDGGSTIIAVYPPDTTEVGERFVRTTELLQEAGVPVPAIYRWDPAAGLMEIADAGDETAWAAVGGGWQRLDLWSRAIPLARAIGSLDPERVTAINPPLDGRILRRELQQSWDLVLAPRGLVGDEATASEFRRALLVLCDKLNDGPLEPGHRDLMVRNLMVGEDRRLTVIDHQDLRMVPRGYDLASLLNDTLYATAAEEAELLAEAELERRDHERYHRAAAQRALKIVGTFAAFAARGSDRYLDRIPPSLAAARRHLERLPETGPLMAALGPTWEPLGTP